MGFRLLINNFRSILQLSHNPVRVVGYGTTTSHSLGKLKIPAPPKQPPNAYIAYLTKHRQDLLKENPNFKAMDIVKQLATKWKHLTAEQKKPYEEKYSEEMLKYKTLKERWWKHLSEEQRQTYEQAKIAIKQSKTQKALKKKQREHGKPKRPLNAYVFFFLEHKNKKHGETQQQLINRLSSAWREMTEKDKQAYIKMATADVQRYKEEMRKWEHEMIKTGNSDLVYPILDSSKTK